MKKITKFNLPEHSNNLYKEEAISSIGLTHEIATKINELIEAYNRLSETDLEWKQTQEGYIRKGVLFMKDNILNSIQELLDLVGVKLIKETVNNEVKGAVTSIANGKVDKNGNEQITLSMLSQEVKEALTGGSVAVVGEGAVNTSNIVDKAITQNKIKPVLFKAFCYLSGEGEYFKPLLIIDIENKSVNKRENYSGNLTLITQGGFHTALNFTETAISDDFWSGSASFEIFIDPVNNIIYITDIYRRDETLNSCIYGGMVTAQRSPRTNIIPLEIDDSFFPPIHITTAQNLSDVTKVLEPYQDLETAQDTPCFNIDGDTFEVTANAAVRNFTCNDRAIGIDFSKVTFKVVPNESGYLGAFFNIRDNEILLEKLENDNINNHDNYYYLGVVATDPYNLRTAKCTFAYTLNNTYLYSPNKVGREKVSLHIGYTNRGKGNKILPYIDFVNRKLVIPPHNNLYAMGKNRYTNIGSGSENPLEIPFPENSGYHYLVGSTKGLKFITSTVFGDGLTRYDVDGYLYFGYVHEFLEKYEFTFECAKAQTFSILGDSISTFSGKIVPGNVTYYNGNNAGVSHANETWWMRTANECGLVLNTNNSWSGSKISTGDPSNNGVLRSTSLDNGTDPDIIFVFMGINDFNDEIPLGDYDGRGVIPEDTTTFRGAYANMLLKIQKRYKYSKIYSLTLPPCERFKDDTNSPESNEDGVFLRDYNEAIREICKSFNVEVIDTDSCGLTHFNGDVYMGDYNTETGIFLHPNREGHKLIADCVIKALK